MSWVWRYLPGAPREVRQADVPAGASASVALLTTNVLQTNRAADRLLRIIVEADPDVVLAVETDEWWCSQLTAALGSHYPHVVQYPLSNGYGLALLSRLELADTKVRFVVDEAIPSIRTGLKLRTGAIIDLYCMHPRPPSPQQDSTERDLELVLVGREIKKRGRPAILLGDLNDVAWSPSTMQFTRAGGLLDPRRGRGFYNTYPARLPALRYPLDYIFNTPHFDVARMRVLPRFGSDHLPLIAALHLRSHGVNE
jgi:endonuclease/exonuclease/phosphatase (EEP) superfamily protein YafD